MKFNSRVAAHVAKLVRVGHHADPHAVRIDCHLTTDVEALFPHYGVLAGKLSAAGVAPTTTMLEVTRLAIPGQMVELEGTAVS